MPTGRGCCRGGALSGPRPSLVGPVAAPGGAEGTRCRSRTPRAGAALAGLALSTFVWITVESLPIGLLPVIAADLRVPQTAVGLLVSAYALVVVVATVPLTALTTRVPRRLLLMALLAVLVLGGVASAAAPSYGVLLAARAFTAIAQAVYWAIAMPVAATLVPPERRGRAVGLVSAGSSLAVLLGVPLGTWIGQVAGWRASFLGTAALGAVALAVIALTLPRVAAAGPREAERGAEPDARRFWLLVAVTAIAVTGGLVPFTYITPYLTEVSGVPAVAVGGLLLVRGAVGLVAVLVVGRLIDARPRAAVLGSLGIEAVGLALQWAGAPVPVLGVLGVVLAGAGLSGFATAVAARVLVVAPGSVDVASGGTSSSWNVGIMAGSAAGGAALPLVGVAGLPLVGGVLAAVGVLLVVVEPRLASGRAAAPA
ncbi:MFS transporter [Amnibacterium setariae]|uniref:MFS transporter n=1 Tax=Amnibacterium setariae TaxID=2306585 RepID=UPI0022784AD7|nr:MFS transporter [Amnibacterium setariae]